MRKAPGPRAGVCDHVPPERHLDTGAETAPLFRAKQRLFCWMMPAEMKEAAHGGGFFVPDRSPGPGEIQRSAGCVAAFLAERRDRRLRRARHQPGVVLDR